MFFRTYCNIDKLEPLSLLRMLSTISTISQGILESRALETLSLYFLRVSGAIMKTLCMETCTLSSYDFSANPFRFYLWNPLADVLESFTWILRHLNLDYLSLLSEESHYKAVNSLDLGCSPDTFWNLVQLLKNPCLEVLSLFSWQSHWEPL